MKDQFAMSFLKFVVGFALIVGASLSIIVAVGYVEQQRERAAAIEALRAMQQPAEVE